MPLRPNVRVVTAIGASCHLPRAGRQETHPSCRIEHMRRLRTRHWLAHHDFHRRTGIGPERLRFCRTRPEKGPIAARLGLTHFVDDRLEVLGYLDTVGHRYLFRPRPDEVTAHAAHLAGVHRVESWPELAATLRAQLTGDRTGPTGGHG
ncbi:hypothetical protein GCM10023176_29910 [Micromonospora coerulea]|uniref:DUF5753 domain-containing protein n=2 Tax=Micromonospora coerulea TaxID=47856 RepID=A0ABP8SMP6_9ACTN